MCQRDPAGLLKNVEHGYPVLPCGFLTDVRTGVLREPSQPVGKRGKASLLVLCPSVCICNSDTGENPCFVDIQPTAVSAKNLKSHFEPPAHQDLRRFGKYELPHKRYRHKRGNCGEVEKDTVKGLMLNKPGEYGA